MKSISQRNYFWILLVVSGAFVCILTCPSYTHASSLQDFDLISENEGWAVIAQQLYWTKTGGQSWVNITPLDIGPARIRAVTFLDTRYGWLIAVRSDESGQMTYLLARTFDGGSSWQNMPLHLFEAGDVRARAGTFYIDFLDAKTGWLVVKQDSSSNFSVGTLFKTTDGGGTWTRLSIPIGEPVYFVNSEVGWIAGGVEGNELYRTQDGGVTWEPQRISHLSTTSQRWSYQLPQFESEQDGVLPVMTTNGETTAVEFYTTHDSGKSWNLATEIPVAQEFSSANQLTLTIFDAKNWLMLNPNSNTLLKIWNRSEISTISSQDRLTSGIMKLDMATTNIGWAKYMSGRCISEPQTEDSSSSQTLIHCTSEAKLLRTHDGGQTWTDLNVPQIDSLRTKRTFITSSTRDVRAQTATFVGQGFDSCVPPSTSQMQTWFTNSPYRVWNVYMGGSCRGCNTLNQDAITPTFISELSQQGWKFIPAWVGPQSACWNGRCSSRISSDTTTAYNQGGSEADAAAATANNLGLGDSVIYYDLEGYDTTSSPCYGNATQMNLNREAAKSFISGWTARLQALGYTAGVYTSTGSGHMSDFASITNIPGAIWPAQTYTGYYDPNASVWGLSYGLTDSLWTNHQRIRQYTWGHNETWGVATLNIDCDVLDGQVASPGPYGGDTKLTQGIWVYVNDPSSYPIEYGQWLDAQFTVKNYGSQAVTFQRIGIGGRAPSSNGGTPNENNVNDLGLETNVTLQPNESRNFWFSTDSFGKNNIWGTYKLTATYQLPDNSWHDIPPGEAGTGTYHQFQVVAHASPSALSNGVGRNDYVPRKGYDHFYIDLPSNVSQLVIQTTGTRSGDYLDLYEKAGSTYPTTSSYDHSVATVSSNETITINNPSSGRHTILVYGYYNGSSSERGTPYTITASYATSDTTPPDTWITSGPSGKITYNDVTFTYTGSDNVTPNASLVYSYWLEGYDSSWSSYTSSTSKTYNDLPNGSYTFWVRAKDQAGNVDPSPAARSFTVQVQASNSYLLWTK